jgi:hypothetical protein
MKRTPHLPATRSALVASAVALAIGLAASAHASPQVSSGLNAAPAASSGLKIGLCHHTAGPDSPSVFITADPASLVADLARGDTLALLPAQCAGPYHHYVTDSLKFGSTVAEADSYAFDLDDDANHVPDNALGHVFAGLSSQLNVDATLAASLQSGDTVILDSLRADWLPYDPTASWQVYLGKPTPQPVLTGGGSFTVDPTAPTSSTLAGSIARGQFTGGSGTLPLRLGLVAGQPPIELHLAGARIQATCDATACTKGKLGGGIPETEVDALIIPAMAAIFQADVDADCTTSSPDSCTPAGAQILDLFDSNHDGQITGDELRSNALIRAVLQPDLDLFAANGAPGHDGTNDSLSVGLGFTAKTAVFAAPGEHQRR